VYWYLSLMARDVPEGATARDLATQAGTALDKGFRAITEATEAGDLRLDELFDRNPMNRWGTGPVTLLGDAAHLMLPHTGQGAAQALEDAVALSLALSADERIDSNLRRYERARSDRTQAMVALGRRIVRTTTTHNALIAGLRTLAVRAVPVTTIMNVFYPGGTEDPHRTLRPGV
jgi:2-polyprenyl-6-methoxyphenol hydroxylase-like FAD-dependent oxidoreductase